MKTTYETRFAGKHEMIRIALPGVPSSDSVTIGLDYEGEKSPRFQVLCYEADNDEVVATLRYDATGKLTEIVIGNDNISVFDSDLPRQSPWQVERDGKLTGPPPPKPMYSVTYANIGCVCGPATSYADALKDYVHYIEASQRAVGRAAGEDVTLWKDGEPFHEYYAPVTTDEGGDA